MSWKVVTKVRERRFGNAHRKAVMLCLADRASDNGAGIWLGNKGIARETEISLNTVKKILKEFVDEGLIEDAGIHHYYRTQQYNILVENVLELPLLDSEGSNMTPVEKVGSNMTPGGSNGRLRGHPMTPEGSPHDPKPNNPNINLSAQARTSLTERLARLSREVVMSKPVQDLLSEADAFDGRRVLISSRYMHDRLSLELSKHLKAIGLKITNDASEMMIEDQAA